MTVEPTGRTTGGDHRKTEGTLIVLQESIGWASTCGVLTTEIASIAAALDYVQESFEQELPKYPFEAPRRVYGATT